MHVSISLTPAPVATDAPTDAVFLSHHRAPAPRIPQPERRTCRCIEVKIGRVNSWPTEYAFGHHTELLTRFRRHT